jgi:hypothetical protein
VTPNVLARQLRGLHTKGAPVIHFNKLAQFTRLIGHGNLSCVVPQRFGENSNAISLLVEIRRYAR